MPQKNCFRIFQISVCLLWAFCLASDVFALADPHDMNHQPVAEFVNTLFDFHDNRPSPEIFTHFLETHFVVNDDDWHTFYRSKDLIEYLVFLDSRVQFLRKNNALLESFLKKTAQKEKRIQVALSRLQKDEKDLFEKRLPDGLSDFGMVRRIDIDNVYQALKDTESFLMTRVKQLQVINNGLRSLKMEALSFKRGEARWSGHQDYQGRLEDMSKALTKKDDMIVAQDRDIQNLKTQYDEVRLGLDMFRDRLQETNKKIDDLVDQMASTSLNLYQKQQEVADKQETVMELDQALDETRERLRLVQHIIQEKDGHIQNLEEEVLQLQSQGENGQEQTALLAFKNEFDSVVQDLRSQIGQSQDKIKRLEKKFQTVALEKAQLESDMMKQGFMLSLLERQIEQKDGMVADLEKGFRLRTEKMFELKGVVRIYQLKLQEYRAMLREKNLELKRLRENAQAKEDKDDEAGTFAAGNPEQRPMLKINIPELIFLSADDAHDFSRAVLQEIYNQGEK